MTQTNEAVVSLDFHDVERFGASAHEHYRAASSLGPVARCPEYGGFHMVLDYDLVCEVLDDPETYSSAEVTFPPIPKPQWIPIEIDPPDHRKYRSLVLGQFTSGGVAELEEPARSECRRLIAAIAGRGSFDVCAEYVQPLTGTIFAVLLGIPPSDRAWFEEVTNRFVFETHNPEAQLTASMELLEYLAKLTAELQTSGGGSGVMKTLIEGEIDGRPMTVEEVVNFAHLLMVAGHDTTSAGLGSAFHTLSRDAELFARLRSEPKQVPRAVEEFLRLDPPAVHGRVVTKNVELGGHQLRAGDHVVIGYTAANRDCVKFPNPDQFDLSRPRGKQIAFGYGIHRCLGANLAALLMRVAIEEFVSAFTGMQTLDPSSTRWSAGMSRGVRSLTVRASR